MTFLLRHINFLTPWTEDLHARGTDFLAHSDRQGMLSFAEHSWTDPKSTFQVFFTHDCKSFGGDDVAGVDEAVYVSGFLVDGEVAEWINGYR